MAAWASAGRLNATSEVAKRGSMGREDEIPR